MNERKKFFLVLIAVIACLYVGLLSYFKQPSIDENQLQSTIINETPQIAIDNDDCVQAKEVVVIKKMKKPTVQLFYRNKCSVLDVFTKKVPPCKIAPEYNESTIAVMGAMVLLMVLIANAALDVIKVKKEERLKRQNNPNEVRRQSLSEYANKNNFSLRRESIKFGQHLFQIAESMIKTEEKKTCIQPRPYFRAESTNSYLTKSKCDEENIMKRSGTPTRESPIKESGTRRAPLLRHMSFPAMSINPDIQSLMMMNRQQSSDSDEDDAKGKRVRLIRRH